MTSREKSSASFVGRFFFFCLTMINLNFDWLNSHIISWWCIKSSPWLQGRKTPTGRKERTTYSPYKEKKAMGQKLLGKSDISKYKQKEKKERNTCGYRGVCISKDDWTKGRGFNESMKTKTKQNKTNITPEKDVMASANQTPGGYKFTPLVASQQGRANQHEPACFGLPSPWPFPSGSGIRLLPVDIVYTEQR